MKRLIFFRDSTLFRKIIERAPPLRKSIINNVDVQSIVNIIKNNYRIRYGIKYADYTVVIENINELTLTVSAMMQIKLHD